MADDNPKVLSLVRDFVQCERMRVRQAACATRGVPRMEEDGELVLLRIVIERAEDLVPGEDPTITEPDLEAFHEPLLAFRKLQRLRHSGLLGLDREHGEELVSAPLAQVDDFDVRQSLPISHRWTEQ